MYDYEDYGNANDATIALNDALLSLKGSTFTREDLEILLMATDDEEWPYYNVAAIMLEVGEIIHEGDLPIGFRYDWDGSPDELAEILDKHRSYPTYIVRYYPVLNTRSADKRNERPFWAPLDEHVEVARNVELQRVRKVYDDTDPLFLWMMGGSERRQGVVVEICEERMRVDGTAYECRLVEDKMFYPHGAAIRRC